MSFKSFPKVRKGPSKKSERQKAVKACDDAFSLYIRERDGHQCYCGKLIANEPLQCCHLFSRSNYSTRWNVNYSACGHRSCNMEHEYHPEKMTLWYLGKFGKDQYEAGVWLHNSVYKVSTPELWIMAKAFKDKYEALKLTDRRSSIAQENGRAAGNEGINPLMERAE